MSNGITRQTMDLQRKLSSITTKTDLGQKTDEMDLNFDGQIVGSPSNPKCFLTT